MRVSKGLMPVDARMGVTERRGADDAPPGMAATSAA